MTSSKQPKPLKMWGILVRANRRSAPWIIPSSVQMTRAAAIASVVPKGGGWIWRKMYRMGSRAVRLNVEMIPISRKRKPAECTLDEFSLVVG